MGQVDPAFWNGRRVLVTGHTGFKGSWATLWLSAMGAEVTGISLPPDTWPSLYELAGVEEACDSRTVDVRDWDELQSEIAVIQPEIVLHLAAQALVRQSYLDPLTTFGTNVMGTANVIEAARSEPGVKAILVVTTDKVYETAEVARPFTEGDPLGGHDPYSASKAAAEIVVASYRRSFLGERLPLMTVRSGNVIGGGDFAADRLVPDIWRAARGGEPLVLRYPQATRPWQHVLDCLAGTFLYVQSVLGGRSVPMALNFGPDAGAAGEATVADLTAAMQAAVGATEGWVQEQGDFPREMGRRLLDSGRARDALGWRDRYDTAEAIGLTAEWYRAMDAGEDMRAVTCAQIAAYA